MLPVCISTPTWLSSLAAFDERRSPNPARISLPPSYRSTRALRESIR
jgi:hypothetical protein